jgi:glycerophosphoryl diester phosphodiesterase
MRAPAKRITEAVDRYIAAMLLQRLAPAPACLVIGHRGAPTELPENTIRSLMQAFFVGADGVELDVVFSPDGCPFVCHDLEISDRVRPLATLKETLVRLTEMDARCIYIHYKRQNERDDNSGHVRAVAGAIRETGLLDKALVMVESGRVDPWLATAPDLQVLQCWTAAKPQKNRFPAEDAIARGLRHIGIYFTRKQLSPFGQRLYQLGFKRLGAYMGFGPIRRLIQRYRGAGRSFVIFTINDPFLMHMCANAGFDAIGTDDPALLARTLRKL